MYCALIQVSKSGLIRIKYLLEKITFNTSNKNSPRPQNRGCGDCQCIMVSHAVYVVYALTCVHQRFRERRFAFSGYSIATIRLPIYRYIFLCSIWPYLKYIQVLIDVPRVVGIEILDCIHSFLLSITVTPIVVAAITPLMAPHLIFLGF